MSEKQIVDHAVVYRDGIGEWRWRAKARNGEVVADSGEGYIDRADALGALERILPDVELRFIEEDA